MNYPYVVDMPLKNPPPKKNNQTFTKESNFGIELPICSWYAVKEKKTNTKNKPNLYKGIKFQY